MELLAVVFIWPFIILATGLVFVAFSDVFFYGFGFLWWLPFLLLFFLVANRKRTSKIEGRELAPEEQLQVLRKILVIFSISLLFPIFTRYLVDAFNGSLEVVIASLVVGFAFLTWGIFVKNNSAIMYSNIIGGAFALFYLYTQLWSLGELPRIIAAAFGLIVAVTISIIKLREKLA